MIEACAASATHQQEPDTMREIAATLIAPLLRVTGLRFNKSWRHANTGFKAFVFAHLLNTTGANIKAGN
jgi:hypothetical protein